jgi:hypothetical protein
MVSQNSPVAVQRRMRAIRGNLVAHADEAVKKARTKLDWRHYVVNYPWATLGAAMAAGYVLAPRLVSKRTCNPGTEVPDGVARARQPSPLSGLVAGMMSAVAMTFAREGAILAVQSLKELFEPQNGESPEKSFAEKPN